MRRDLENTAADFCDSGEQIEQPWDVMDAVVVGEQKREVRATYRSRQTGVSSP